MARVSSEAPPGKVGPDMDRVANIRQLLQQYRLIQFGNLSCSEPFFLQPHAGLAPVNGIDDVSHACCGNLPLRHFLLCIHACRVG